MRGGVVIHLTDVVLAKAWHKDFPTNLSLKANMMSTTANALGCSGSYDSKQCLPPFGDIRNRPDDRRELPDRPARSHEMTWRFDDRWEEMDEGQTSRIWGESSHSEHIGAAMQLFSAALRRPPL